MWEEKKTFSVRLGREKKDKQNHKRTFYKHNTIGEGQLETYEMNVWICT